MRLFLIGVVALLLSSGAAPSALAIDLEFVDLTILRHDSGQCADFPHVGEGTCIEVVMRNNGPGILLGECTFTITFQDPGGNVLVSESQDIPSIQHQPLTIMLENHSYTPTTNGQFTVTGFLRPTSHLVQDENLSNNSIVETYDVLGDDPVFACSYDSLTGELTYSVSGAPNGFSYSVSTVEHNVQLAAPPANLIGPADSESIGVSCLGSGNGFVEIQISNGAEVVWQCNLCFECSGLGATPSLTSCNPPPTHVPSASVPIAAACAIALMTMGVVLLARRRA